MKYFLSIIAFILCVLSFVGCKEKKSPPLTRISDMKYTTISDSLYSMSPAALFYQDSKLYWMDPMCSEGFMHIVDAGTGKEISRFGNLGDGPEEFNAPLVSPFPEGGIYIKDGTRRKAAIYHLKGGQITSDFFTYPGGRNATAIASIQKKSLVYLYPNGEMPFELQKGNRYTGFGHFPTEETGKDGFNVFQGALKYNAEKEYLMYASAEFPYIAVYNLKDDKCELVCETNNKLDYTVTDGEVMPSRKAPFGIWELSFTKDYIITVQNDEKTEGRLTRKDIFIDQKLPHSVFVYDYDLNPIRIYHFPFKVLRISGDSESNTVYLIVEDKEFKIIKFQITD